MNTRFAHHAAALTLAIVTTFAVFSGVSHLAAPSHAGAVLAQQAATASHG